MNLAAWQGTRMRTRQEICFLVLVDTVSGDEVMGRFSISRLRIHGIYYTYFLTALELCTSQYEHCSARHVGDKQHRTNLSLHSTS
jgi:hypothetical protein